MPVALPILNQNTYLGSSSGHASIDFTAYYLPNRNGVATSDNHTIPTSLSAFMTRGKPLIALPDLAK
jgi:hypothetical protein